MKALYQYTLGRGGSGMGMSYRFQQMRCPHRAVLDKEAIATGRRTSNDNDDTLCGTLLHALFEVWSQVGESFDPMQVEFVNLYGDSMATPWRTSLTHERGYREALDVCAGYMMLHKRSLDHLGKILVREGLLDSKSTAIQPITHGLEYTGAYDMLVERKGKLYVLDLKFPSRLATYDYSGTEEWWKEKMYCLAASMMDIPIAGGIIHVVQRKRPIQVREYLIDMPTPSEIQVLSDFFKACKEIETNPVLKNAKFINSCRYCSYNNAGCIKTR